LSAGNINLKADSVVIRGFDNRVKSSLHMHPNKYNNSEGVQRLTLRRKIRLDSSVNLKDKLNQSTMSSLNDSIVSSARKQILDSTSSKR
jgi:hypothetical protein